MKATPVKHVYPAASPWTVAMTQQGEAHIKHQHGEDVLASDWQLRYY